LPYAVITRERTAGRRVPGRAKPIAGGRGDGPGQIGDRELFSFSGPIRRDGEEYHSLVEGHPAEEEPWCLGMSEATETGNYESPVQWFLIDGGERVDPFD
jgi:hypothetical protein